jgi:hypothetical protein
MKVGDKVYLVPVNNQARYIAGYDIFKHIKEDEIVKIGKKYFYLKEHSYYKFGITEMHDVSNYCANYVVYLNLQDFKDEKEKETLSFEIKKYFSSYGQIKLTLERLRQIYFIIRKESDI